MSRKKKSGGDGGGGANWMDTYGDLVTLLLCFFVMLFASSTISEEKWREIVASFRGEPAGAIIEPITQFPTQGFNEGELVQERYDSNAEDLEKSEQQEQIEEQFSELFEQLSEYVDAENLQQTIMLNAEGLYIRITILDGILFDSGRAEIRDEEAENALANVAILVGAYLDSIENITVEGHTDNVPISNAQFKDNRSLSSERANEVARFMTQAGGIPDWMFTSLGQSEWHPIATNDTEEGKEMNRRVEILLIAKNVDAVQPALPDIEASTLIENRPQILESEVQIPADAEPVEAE